MSSNNNKSRLSGSTWKLSAGPFDTQIEDPYVEAAKPYDQSERDKFNNPTSTMRNSSKYSSNTRRTERRNQSSTTESSARAGRGRDRDRFRELKSYKERYQDVKDMSTPPRRSSTPKETRSYSAERYATREGSLKWASGVRSRSYDKHMARQRARELSPHERYNITSSNGRSSRADLRARDASSPSRDVKSRSPNRTSRVQNKYMDRWERRKEQKGRKSSIDPDGARVSQTTYTSRADRWSPRENVYDDEIFGHHLREHSRERRSSSGDESPLFDDVDEEGAGNIHVSSSSPLSIGNHFDDTSENPYENHAPPRTSVTPRVSASRTSGISRSQKPKQLPRRSPGYSTSSKSSSQTKSTYADDLASFTQSIATAVIQNAAFDAESQSYQQDKKRGANALGGRYTQSKCNTAKKSKMKYFVVALLLAVLCIVAAIAAVVYLEYMKDKEKTPMVMPTPTPPTSNDHPPLDNVDNSPPASSSQHLEDREKLIDEYLETLSSGRSSNIGSPQFKAKNWLLFDDDLDLHLPSSGENRDDTEVAQRLKQRFALATMYYSMGVGPGGVVKGWLEGDECRFVGDYGRAWDGVDCNEDGTVRAIALDAANLQGTIPAEIGLLSYVENLIIKNNPNLAGEIPHQIGNQMTQLRQLGLYGNNLEGSIPKSVFKLSHLVYLNLSDNVITGEVNWKEISHHQKKIERLILQNNLLEGSIDFHVLSKTPLLLLVLSNNQFGGYIEESVGSMGSLQYLYLDKNKLIGSIPDAIGNLANIKSINLDENEIYGTLPHSLGSLANLEHFSAKQNTISGGFPASMKLLHNLETLNLARNAMSGHLRNLPHMKKLKNLHLYQNSFVGSIPENLFELPRLEVLFLSSNLLTGEIPSSITDAQQTLKALYISDNKIQGQIPADLCGLYKLEDLFIDTNDFTGSLPTCLGSLSNLKKLYAFKNRFSGDVPSVLLSLPNLVEIGLEENDLTGGVNQVCDWDRGLHIWADCSELKGGCECCQRCCSDVSSC